MLAQRIGNREDVLIAAAAHIHDDEPVFTEFFGEVDGAWQGVTGFERWKDCLLYTSPSPRDATLSRMPSSA